MPLKTSMWIHGSIGEVEDSASLTKAARKGVGRSFTGKPAKSTWFHFPIATPATLDDISPQLVKVYIFYVTDPTNALGPASNVTRITNVHLYDGRQKIKSFDNLELKGDHGSSADAQNSLAVNPPLKVSHGLGVSVKVQFAGLGPDLGNPSMDILFTTAGADFQKP
jgi:hypothetical protein